MVKINNLEADFSVCFPPIVRLRLLSGSRTLTQCFQHLRVLGTMRTFILRGLDRLTLHAAWHLGPLLPCGLPLLSCICTSSPPTMSLITGRKPWVLTCHCHMPVGFAFVYHIHDLLGARHKPLSAPLEGSWKQVGWSLEKLKSNNILKQLNTFPFLFRGTDK